MIFNPFYYIYTRASARLAQICAKVRKSVQSYDILTKPQSKVQTFRFFWQNHSPTSYSNVQSSCSNRTITGHDIDNCCGSRTHVHPLDKYGGHKECRHVA